VGETGYHDQQRKLPEKIDEAERNLIASGIEVYQRLGSIVRIGRFPSKEGQYLQFVPLRKESIAELMTKAMRWVKFDGRSKTWTATDCPDKIASSYLARNGNWKLPHVRCIISAPTIRLDGTILDRRGYDPQTRLYYDPQGVVFPPIPENPTLEDARRRATCCLGWSPRCRSPNMTRGGLSVGVPDGDPDRVGQAGCRQHTCPDRGAPVMGAGRHDWSTRLAEWSSGDGPVWQGARQQ